MPGIPPTIIPIPPTSMHTTIPKIPTIPTIPTIATVPTIPTPLTIIILKTQKTTPKTTTHTPQLMATKGNSERNLKRNPKKCNIYYYAIYCTLKLKLRGKVLLGGEGILFAIIRLKVFNQVTVGRERELTVQVLSSFFP
jgi:hypothetical protein